MSRHQLFGAIFQSAFKPNAQRTDPETEGLTKAPTLAPNSNIISVAFFFNPDASQPFANVALLDNDDFSIYIQWTAGSETIDIAFADSAFVRGLEYNNIAAASGQWHSVLIACDFAGARQSCFVDNVQQTPTLFTTGAGVINYNQPWYIGDPNIGFTMLGCHSQWWIDNTYVDFSTLTTRRKFVSSTNEPINLGAAGELPTGASPFVYLPNPAATWNVNAGTRGNYALNGAPSVCASAP